MRVLVQLRGTNGSGKSTVPMQMREQDSDYEEVGLGPNGKSPYITIFPNLKWVALGTYHAKTGGMDTFKNNEATRLALDYAWKNYPTYDILMEGIIASTVKSTYADLFHDYEVIMGTDYVDRKIIIMNFLPPVEVCIDRVYARNGGKPIKVEQLEGKWRTVNRNAMYFKDKGFTSIKIDTNKWLYDDVLNKFIGKVEKYRGTK